MSIEVTARHMTAAGIQDYARGKAEELIDGFDEIEHIHVVLDVEKHRQEAEVLVQGRHHLRLDSSESSDTMSVSVDTAFERMEKQLRKHRDKLRGHRVKLTDIENEDA